ncbi:MAG: competence/damage-inducible protein A [Limnochordaceae bacterium]|nr:competence/damage-inducible protein A [Limnochordaceae bacterium]
MEAEIISVGTELLLGEIVDTNAAYLARSLAQLGLVHRHRQTVGDNIDRIVAAIRWAVERSQVVVLTGGLGPTQDDLTREGLAAATGRTLEFDPQVWEKIQGHLFAGVHGPASLRRQAQVPAGAQALTNRVGTAPGLWLETGEALYICLPGVPREMEVIWSEEVVPRLTAWLARRRHGGGQVIYSRVFHFVGIREADMEDRVKDLEAASTNPTLAPYAGEGECRLRLTVQASDEGEAKARLQPVEAEVRRRLGRWLYGVDGQTLEEVVGRLLAARGERLATAESCTGGLLARRVTSVPGSSAYFERGWVTYSNQAKHECLGVEEEALARFGAVSQQVAGQMARGARLRAGVDWALATTGIAGPGGGSAEKPVGLVYIALAGPAGEWVERHQFLGDRGQVQQRAATTALGMLWRELTAAEGAGQGGA